MGIHPSICDIIASNFNFQAPTFGREIAQFIGIANAVEVAIPLASLFPPKNLNII